MTQIILPEAEKENILKVKRGTPETVAETYYGSSDLKMINERYSLFVFDVLLGNGCLLGKTLTSICFLSFI